MNSKARMLIKNLTYTVSANILSLLISTITVLILPKLISIEEYGFLQLYIFYSSYVGFFQFGWNDGIYLRYGGKDYDRLDKRLFFSQFWMLMLSQVILAIIISVLSLILANESERRIILVMVALCMISVGVRAMLLFILQMTNRIKEYALITILEKIIYFSLILLLLLAGIRQYKLVIIVDLIAKFASFAYAIYFCRDIIFRSITSFYFSFSEAVRNINVGIKLMFANIAGMLIIGIVRFSIERFWNVATFGKVSLTLSVSNLMMLFINAIGIIMFPILRKTDEKKLQNIYITLRDILMIILFGALLLYYPLRAILSEWLPKYSGSLMYMALVFPMCIFEGKMALLINTYLKTLRKEKLMLKVNLISLVLSTITTFITSIILKNLDLSIASIVFLLAFRCVLAEVSLSKILTISLYKDIILELIMTVTFILTGWFINSWVAVLLYGVAFMIYLGIKRLGITNSIKNITLLMKA